MAKVAIGGYFSLELPSGKRSYYPQAIAFQSARAAFLALLQCGRPARVWAPWYLCESMLEPLYATGIPLMRYALTTGLQPEENIQFTADDWLLYVNYFGVSSRAVDAVLARFPPQQVVLDYSQAFYSPPRDCLATIYSPRKFFGVPDGGYLLTRLSVEIPEAVDDGSLGRCTHLLKRLSGEPETGYADYCRAEASLENQLPKRMSELTRKILCAIDYDSIRLRRQQNFSELHARLGKFNRFIIDVDENSVPLCYPFWSEHAGLHAELIAARIFVPTYWREIITSSQAIPEFERSFAQGMVPLPCDQRYAPHDLKVVVDLIENSLSRDSMCEIEQRGERSCE